MIKIQYLPYPPLLPADPPNQSGTGCLASVNIFTRSATIPPSVLKSKKLVALPVFPTRPVLPILKREIMVNLKDQTNMIYLWTYSSTSFGMEKLMTCVTLLISKPLAATAVATRIGFLPLLKSSRACSRSSCARSPDIQQK